MDFMDSELFEARADARPRSPAARAMYQMAARRGVYGPYNIATHIRKRRGEGPTGPTFSTIFSGQYRKPSPDTLRAFVEGFDLFPEEVWRLAYVVAFQEEPPEGLR
jgi:hypothetical protein